MPRDTSKDLSVAMIDLAISQEPGATIEGQMQYLSTRWGVQIDDPTDTDDLDATSLLTRSVWLVGPEDKVLTALRAYYADGFGGIVDSTTLGIQSNGVANGLQGEEFLLSEVHTGLHGDVVRSYYP